MSLFSSMGGMMDRLENIAGEVSTAMTQVGQMGEEIGMLQKIVHFARNGGNPMQLITAFAQRNPKANAMLGNLQGKSEPEMRSFAENMAKEYGTSVEDVVRGLGLTMPK